MVAKWIHAQGKQRKRADQPPTPKLPSPKQLAWWLVQSAADRDSDAEEQSIWTYLQQDAGFAELHDLAQAFGAMIRHRDDAALDGWLERARASASPEFRNFAAGLERGYAAIHATLTLPWSTGPVEGHINRLILIKRSAYGRANFDLLRQRVLLAA